MTKIWYNDIYVLLEKPYQFFPSNNLTGLEKINALARLAIYYAIIIIFTGRNHTYLTFSVVMLMTSFFLGRTNGLDNSNESFTLSDSNNKIKNSNTLAEKSCYKPTDENPFMNFTLNDYYKNPDRPQNCPINEVKNEMRTKFLKRIVPDPTDLWGQNMSDRNFYTMPSTRIVNDQTGFANWCYGSMGQCKSNGIGCLKSALTRTGTGMFGSDLVN